MESYKYELLSVYYLRVRILKRQEPSALCPTTQTFALRQIFPVFVATKVWVYSIGCNTYHSISLNPTYGTFRLKRNVYFYFLFNWLCSWKRCYFPQSLIQKTVQTHIIKKGCATPHRKRESWGFNLLCHIGCVSTLRVLWLKSLTNWTCFPFVFSMLELECAVKAHIILLCHSFPKNIKRVVQHW